MLLAGDVGATKTLLGLYAPAPVRPALVECEAFPTLDFDGLGQMIDVFLRAGRHGGVPLAAAFGVAGPVRGNVAQLTNAPWSVDAIELTTRFSFTSLALLNDLEAMAHAVPVLTGDEVHTLQAGRPAPDGNMALIAAGTGLGEALLHRVDGRFVPSPTESGHTDFAARTDREIGLLRALSRAYGRVDVEHVVSGPGLVNIHRYLHPDGCKACDDVTGSAEAPAAITRAALEGRCPRCVETLDLFVEAYGAEAGNHALRSMATSGVYLGGGIAPKILPALERGRFMEAFRAKSPMGDLLAAMPVLVILNQQAALLGAAVRANRAVAARP